MPQGPDETPNGPSSGRPGQSRRTLANQQRLEALGQAVDQKNGGTRSSRRRARGGRRRTGRIIAISGLVVVLVVAGVIGGSYLYANWQFGKIHKITVSGEAPKPISGQPFNILMIGSDSRVGLSGILAKETGAATGVEGQRSDVVKIIHVDPDAGTISMVSIPRDTMVTLLANQSLYGKFNRINVNFGNGPSLLVKTIEANFGIPIHQTIVVSFAGLINAADALGGVYLDFPYPSADPESGLYIHQAGCQLVKGFPALAVTRSRHFYYNVKGLYNWPKDWADLSEDQMLALGWYYDGTSDLGRIDRQNAFLRAMVDQAKKAYDPVTLNSFLSALPQGVTLDSNFSLNELIGLAVRFHSINPNAIATYTLPTYSGTVDGNDVLFVQEPEAQQLLVGIFGHGLTAPTNPPPNQALATPPPPYVAVTTTTTTTTTTLPSTSSTVKHHKTTPTTLPTTTTTYAGQYPVPNFDPKPCVP